jgi:hypothetical protein
LEVGRDWGMIRNGHITVDTNSYEKVKTFKHLGSQLTNQSYIHEEIKWGLQAGNACYYSVHSRLLSKNLKIKVYKTKILVVVLYGLKHGLLH